MLTDRLRRKSTSKKKIQIKAWYRILSTEMLCYDVIYIMLYILDSLVDHRTSIYQYA